MRVTQNMIYRRFLTNLERLNDNIARSFEEISSGKKINRPSDDPFGAAKALGYYSELHDIDQYNRNINQAIAWMNITETAFKQMEDVVIKTQEIALSQASDTATAETRKAMAGQIRQLKGHFLQIANTKLGDRYIFAGFKTNEEPFQSDNYYHGDTNKIKVNISPYMHLGFNITGEFLAPQYDPTSPPTLTPENNIFQLYDELADALENNNSNKIRKLLSYINEFYGKINKKHAELGNIMERFEKVQLELSNMQGDISKLLSDTEDADIAKTTSNLAMCQTMYQSTLAAMAKVIQNNLLNYLT